MIKLKKVLLFLVIIGSCYCQHTQIKYIKKKHHGLHHIKFLHYLIFLAIKLKLVVFFGTIFTIGLLAAKIFGIIKLSEYMKHTYKHHHEEKIVYENPHEHHDYGGFVSPSDFSSSKVYPSSYPGSDVALDHPPDDAYIHERYGTAFGQNQYGNSKIGSRSYEENYGTDIYNAFLQIAKKLRRLNITEKAFNEMGIKDDYCKKKFVCQADYNAKGNFFLQTGFDILSDDSYQKYKSNVPVTSEKDCYSLYSQCQDDED